MSGERSGDEGRGARVEAVAAALAAGGVERAEEEARAIVAHVGRDAARALELAAARVGGTPLAYLFGRTRFMGVELLSEEGALVPREETEILGRAARERLLAVVAERGSATAIDMCCGSGNLACALATLVPEARFYASDLTDGCVRLTRRNVEHLGLGDRVTVVQGDLFAPLAELGPPAVPEGGLAGAVDVIVCNPPYISTGRLGKDRAHLLEHEPREAFDGGPYGLSIHQRVIREAPHYLRPGGWLLFEMGLGQEKQLGILFERSKRYEAIELDRDEAGAPRVVRARLQAVPTAGEAK